MIFNHFYIGLPLCLYDLTPLTYFLQTVVSSYTRVYVLSYFPNLTNCVN